MKGTRISVQDRQTGQHHGAQYLQRSVEGLQRLEKEQKIPFRPGDVGGVGGVGQLLQRHAHRYRHHEQNGEGDKNGHGIFENLARIELLPGQQFIARRRRHTMLADQVNVDGDQQQSGRRQQEHVESIKACEGHHTDLARTTHQSLHIGAYHWRQSGQPRGHHSAPIGPIVPGQEVSGKAVRQRHQQQHHAYHPGGLARLLVGAIQKYLDHVQHHHHDHHAGAPVMEPANQPARCQFGEDVSHAVIGIARRRRVVERQQGARKCLGHEQEDRHAPEHLVPPAGGRDLFIEELADSGL